MGAMLKEHEESADEKKIPHVGFIDLELGRCFLTP